MDHAAVVYAGWNQRLLKDNSIKREMRSIQGSNSSSNAKTIFIYSENSFLFLHSSALQEVIRQEVKGHCLREHFVKEFLARALKEQRF